MRFGLFHLLAGTLLMASKPILIKILINLGLSTIEIMALRNILALPLYLVILIVLYKRGFLSILSLKLVLGIIGNGLICFQFSRYFTFCDLEKDLAAGNSARGRISCRPPI